jgi:hypothetical protein
MSQRNSSSKSESSDIFYIVERFENISEAWAKGIKSKQGIALLIKWEGYSARDNSWEPVENLSLEHSIDQLYGLVTKSSIRNSKKKKSLIQKAIQFLQKKKDKFEKKRRLQSDKSQINHKIEESAFSRDNNAKSEELNQLRYKRQNMETSDPLACSRKEDKGDRIEVTRQKSLSDVFSLELQTKSHKEQAQSLICAMLDEADIKSSVSHKKVFTKQEFVYSPKQKNSIKDTLEEKLLIKSVPKQTKETWFELDSEIFNNPDTDNGTSAVINGVEQNQRSYSLEKDQQDQRESSLNLDIEEEQDHNRVPKRSVYETKEYTLLTSKEKTETQNKNNNELTKVQKEEKLVEDNNSTEINEKTQDISQLYENKISKNLFAKKHNKEIFKLFNFKNPFKSLETKLTFQNNFLKKCFLSDTKDKHILFTKRNDSTFLQSQQIELHLRHQESFKCLRERVSLLKSQITSDKSLEQLIERSCDYHMNCTSDVFQNNTVKKMSYITANSNLIQNISFKQFVYSQTDLPSTDYSIKIIPSSFSLTKVTDRTNICVKEEFTYLENYFKQGKSESYSSANLAKSVLRANKKIFSEENNKNLVNNNINSNHLHRFGSVKKFEEDDFVNNFHVKSTQKLIHLIEQFERTEIHLDSCSESFKTFSQEGSQICPDKY